MKKIYIVGAGLGAGSLTADAAAAIGESQAVFGAERLLSEYSELLEGKRFSGKYAAADVLEDVLSAKEDCFSVLVSGDPGFYSAALKLCEAFRGREGFEVKVLPGISSLNALFAALKMPWQDAALCSLHGRDANAADMVRRNKMTFFLTGKNTALLAEKLIGAGFGGITLHVGEDLGSPDQKVFSCTAEELKDMELSSLTVVAAENPDADSRVRTGIPDECFTRGDVPMTKAEVRAVIMSKLAIKPHYTCADIGAGTGSCTVEMALAAWKGRVFAVDPEPEAVRLIKENCRAFHIGNVEAVQGMAPEDIRDWPALDAVFIGGSKGNMREIFDEVLGKNPKARIVTSAIVLQTVSDALSAFEAHGIVPEVVQICAAVSKRVGGKDMMMARNPIYIISGGGED
ncbi:MAG: precorrin-6y C5,15-methyltransferase (decarboxylating) subunit CbiE [Firmicutes bacterium]|nr:precorrin-6y C5,15-methyltransferase (decarboxylating) subunit CbiE [Bacillota bacterium]